MQKSMGRAEDINPLMPITDNHINNWRTSNAAVGCSITDFSLLLGGHTTPINSPIKQLACMSDALALECSSPLLSNQRWLEELKVTISPHHSTDIRPSENQPVSSDDQVLQKRESSLQEEFILRDPAINAGDVFSSEYFVSSSSSLTSNNNLNATAYSDLHFNCSASRSNTECHVDSTYQHDAPPLDLLNFVMHLTDTPPHRQSSKPDDMLPYMTCGAKYNAADIHTQETSTDLISEASVFVNPSQTEDVDNTSRSSAESFSDHIQLHSNNELDNVNVINNNCVTSLMPNATMAVNKNTHALLSVVPRAFPTGVTLPMSQVSRTLGIPVKGSTDGTSRSAFSFMSSNGFGTITTASSTPSHLSDTPSLSQDVLSGKSANNTIQIPASLTFRLEPARSGSSCQGSPVEDVPEDELVDLIANFNTDEDNSNNGHISSLLSAHTILDMKPEKQRTTRNDDNNSKCSTDSSMGVIRTLSSEITTTQAPLNLLNGGNQVSSYGSAVKKNLETSDQNATAAIAYSMLQSNQKTAVGGYGNQESESSNTTTASFGNGNKSCVKQERWDDASSWDRQNYPSRQIPKGLTDFYALTFASKRWQNLNVVFPLFVPHGIVSILRSTGENTYVFPDTHPGAQLLFSGAGKICDIWASYLRLRVAVIHKCPEFLVPKLAQVFNAKLAELPKFSEPITLSSSGLVKHTIQLRSSGSLTYRYDTIGQLVRSEDQVKMRAVFTALQGVLTEVNNHLAQEVEQILEHLQQRNKIDEDIANNRSRCGLEFRFSPCKELKIAVREGTLCDCLGVDSLVAGGGASSMSTWAQQFAVEPLIIGEVRLERDKTSETQLDPFFLPEHEVKTRMITKDLDGKSARACFVDPAIYPASYRPQVRYALNATALEAAQMLCGATHRSLAKLLPNGMASLTGAPGTITASGFVLPVHTGNEVNFPYRPSVPPITDVTSMKGMAFNTTASTGSASVMGTVNCYTGASASSRGCIMRSPMEQLNTTTSTLNNHMVTATATPSPYNTTGNYISGNTGVWQITQPVTAPRHSGSLLCREQSLLDETNNSRKWSTGFLDGTANNIAAATNLLNNSNTTINRSSMSSCPASNFVTPAITMTAAPSSVRDALDKTIAALHASATELPPEATSLLSQLHAVLEKVPALNDQPQSHQQQQQQQDPDIPTHIKGPLNRPLEGQCSTTTLTCPSGIITEEPFLAGTSTSLDSTVDLRTESESSHIGDYHTSKSAGATPAHGTSLARSRLEESSRSCAIEERHTSIIGTDQEHDHLQHSSTLSVRSLQQTRQISQTTSPSSPIITTQFDDDGKMLTTTTSSVTNSSSDETAHIMASGKTLNTKTYNNTVLYYSNNISNNNSLLGGEGINDEIL